MSGITELDLLLKTMSPVLLEKQYIIISTQENFEEIIKYNPIAIIQEKEGKTIIIEKNIADNNNIKYKEIFKCITLNVNSSLSAIGFTAVISNELTKNKISANVIAGYYHDHLLVNEVNADDALKVLLTLEKKVANNCFNLTRLCHDSC